MRKGYQFMTAFLLTIFCTIAVYSQNVTISGTVINQRTKTTVPAVSVTIKGTGLGTYTSDKGVFRISTTQPLPLTLVISSIGYQTREVEYTGGGELNIELEEGSDLGTEVVVSASRLAERIIESPVSVERLNAAAVRSSAAPSYYQGLANMKGVDMTYSSITFPTLSTRGFNGSGNLRFNQLTDGMDNQAPALNFSVGVILGPTELDIESAELLQGASSALYGSGGTNGTLLITSKDPFKYQGFSFQAKTGVNHVDNKQRDMAMYHDYTFRWAKKLSEKFAVKVGGQYMRAADWQAQDTRNLSRNNVLSEIKSGDRMTDPNYDGISVFGDEASVSMQSLAQVVRGQVSGAPNGNMLLAGLDNYIQAGYTPQQIAGAMAGDPNLAPYVSYLPFLLATSGVANNPYAGLYGNQLVSRTGYDERNLVDYNAYSIKANAGLYYKITPGIEASLLGYWGKGTTVYQGADRYFLKNFIMGQYRAEVKAKNWFLRAYTSQENSGDSYTTTTAALGVNATWKGNTDWFSQYSGTYGAAALGIIPNPANPGTFLPVMNPQTAHGLARQQADGGRFLPGSQDFNNALSNVTSIDIKDGGAKFSDKSALYHFEGQYNLSEQIKFVDVLVGANYRIYHLNSRGTIFADTTGPINIGEYGGYVQLQKKLFNDVLKLTATGRYDKSKNFDGRFTPRVTALIQVAKDNNIRLSYQQAYRFPSTQDQYINLNVPGARLIGGLPQFQQFFEFDTRPVYTAESIAAFRSAYAAGNVDPTLLKQATFKELKPEIANSYEIGYRGLVTNNLLIDAYLYFCNYENFIGRTAVGRAMATPGASIVNPLTSENYSSPQNSENRVKAVGWGIGGEYRFPGTFFLKANVSGDQLRDVPPGLVTFFNTPKVRYNVGVGAESIRMSRWGFNIAYRWQDAVQWQSTFASGMIDAYGTVDAQVNYKLPNIKSFIKLGASNVLNKYYVSALGNPAIGGVYYVSFAYNVF
ncbi:TonB-dependent receptor domain-containing protein [Gynurincola endophyticus]|uniref:TonB-dependent receptor domain-containing protein n=1 Tax=Gynurincola endophyticus TaxID=2479004 RepID=UPI000F8CFB3E|nr:TonB-dependent receptor [Gynurincola endophyticus]